MLLLGSIANQHGDVGPLVVRRSVPRSRSAIWFIGLGYGARRAHRLLSSPRSWQVLDVLIGLTMLAIALMLALS